MGVPSPPQCWPDASHTKARESTLAHCGAGRGEEYLPGDFPSPLSDLPGHVRFSLPGQTEPRGRRAGLFDVRVSPDVVTVVANGLGGGSLINAGVMLAPHEAVLGEAAWPKRSAAMARGSTASSNAGGRGSARCRRL